MSLAISLLAVKKRVGCTERSQFIGLSETNSKNFFCNTGVRIVPSYDGRCIVSVALLMDVFKSRMLICCSVSEE